jgi:hypothetical protein
LKEDKRDEAEAVFWARNMIESFERICPFACDIDIDAESMQIHHPRTNSWVTVHFLGNQVDPVVRVKQAAQSMRDHLRETEQRELEEWKNAQE